MEKKIYYFGNFDYKTGFSSVNRAIGIGMLFEKFGFSTYIFCDNVSQSRGDYVFLANHNIHISSKKFSGKFNYRGYLDILETGAKPEAIVLYDFPYFIFKKIMPFCKRNNIKIIADYTEWYDTKNTKLLFKLFKKIDVFQRMHFMPKFTDGSICVSDYLLNYFKMHFKLPVIRVYPINDYLIYERCNVDTGVRDKSINFCYTGNPGRGKDNLSKIIKIFSELRNDNVKLYVAGNFNIDYFPANDNRITFCGNLNRIELTSLLSKMDYQFIIRENTRANNAGFPTKFVESLCYGVKIISTEISDIPLFAAKYNELIHVGNIKDFNPSFIENIIDNGNKEELSQSYFVDINSMFSSNAFLSDFKELLNMVGLI